MVWYSHLLKNFPQFVVIHTVKGFGIINKTEADVFLELSCLFNDATDVGNLISGLPKSYIWIFYHYLLEHIFGGASEMLSPRLWPSF